jgi:hypothetical protein
MVVTVWKQGLTCPRFHTGTVCYHMGIRDKWIHVSIWVVPYGNGDWYIPIRKGLITVSIHTGIKKVYGNGYWRVPVSIQGLSFTIQGFKTSQSPFPYGHSHIQGLTHPHFHMGTIQSLTHFHMVSVLNTGVIAEKDCWIFKGRHWFQKSS